MFILLVSYQQVLCFLWFFYGFVLNSIIICWFIDCQEKMSLGWTSNQDKPNRKTNTLPALVFKDYTSYFDCWYLSIGSIAVELYFIYTSLWFNKIFYMFGFLFFSFLLLTLTSSLVTILITYHSLCLENWKWQWRGFIIGGAGCALYVFIHSILFTKFKLGGFTTIVLYVGYSSVISLLCCLVTGSIGFISSMLFVRKIYSSIKVD